MLQKGANRIKNAQDGRHDPKGMPEQPRLSLTKCLNPMKILI